MKIASYACLIVLLLSTFGFGQKKITPQNSITPQFYQSLKYRNIGPFRGGRTVGAVGIPTQPNVFFFGHNNGGVWKTDDYGRTWNPIFDDAPTGSVGDLAVSPTNPDIIYVGTGEGLHRPDLAVGDGMFKTTDGGMTWKHIGLDDIQQVSRVIVHPTNPDIVFVAGLGHPYGPNEMRGIFRSLDGGKNWEKTLYINKSTGAVQVEFDPNNPNILFADMWEHLEGPWENAKFSGSNSGLYKSIDGGATWKKITKGLPMASQGLGRIGVAIAHSDSNKMYATVDAKEKGGIYGSNDAGESWSLLTTDYRLWGRGSDFAEIKVHPINENVLFVGNIASYKSEDGGKSWTSLKGAPGGDDYHRIWINPLYPDIMLFAADQGAVVTVNGGKTWSSWYNQPTAQLYHVSTDNQFPYWVYGGQQESGAIAVASRSNGGQISFREFMGVGADEYAYVAPDPKDPNIIYGGRVIRFDKHTGQSQVVAPEILRSGEVRFIRTMPLMFHPADDQMLLFGTNMVFKTLNGGQAWEKISPDLTRGETQVPPHFKDYVADSNKPIPPRAIVYALGPSPLNKDVIWAGTDDGLIHVTQNGGKNWINVTPPEIGPWDKISQIDASHFNEGTAYIAVNSIRNDNMKPLIYKTHDFGKTWKKITKGMNPIGPVNTVREDHTSNGLLFAGTEREVYFSIDDGTNWQSLRSNMPASSIRDLVIHENDLVIGTHGRSIWILDDFSPLRELVGLTDDSKPHLFEPSDVFRVRFNMFADTPLPPEEPTGENPPDGAFIDYFLPDDAQKVTLEILDADNVLINRFSSQDILQYPDSTKLPHPTYWMRPLTKPSSKKGHQRFTWNLRYADPPGAKRTYAIAAVLKNTPVGPVGPFVAPGKYKVRLTVDGSIHEKEFSVHLDPRSKLTDSDLQLQTELSMDVYKAYLELQDIRETSMAKLESGKLRSKKKSTIMAFIGIGNPENGDPLYGSIRATSLENETIVKLQEKLLYLLVILQNSDSRPTVPTEEAVKKLWMQTDEMKSIWTSISR
ncbi:VPS10 domain-containing protein [Croceitalea rosinachiae]|uniref:Glycoside hydrolase n=1 Tax=Croceitalea rosinachiae TaxID=3075596 RepID=A0ABU3ADK1_9FLAO|nr:glycoside hydrolase [Croceitalea sp. F388]MDT0607592.1 glycoside hydrolase [Croceitalea sp. F388]